MTGLALWMGLTGCGEPAVEGVPDGSVEIAVDAGEWRVAEGSAAPLVGLVSDPLSPSDPSVMAALAPHRGRPGHLRMAPEVPFVALRKLVNSARSAGLEPLVISTGTRAYPWTAPPRYGLGGTCPDGALRVRGASPLITLSVQTGSDGTWLLGTTRFLPVVEHRGDVGPVDGFPPECLKVPACAELFPSDAPSRGACEEGAARPTKGPARVALGGPTGCLAPIAKSPEDFRAWPDAVRNVVGSLGLGAHPLRMVMPEARVRTDALLAIFEAFDRAGLPPPAVGTTLLVQGNDGPPLCTAPVKGADALSQAGARWLGALAARRQGPQ